MGAGFLASDHKQCYSEYPVSTIIDGHINHLIIDRWFIDTTDTLWIIDYKISQTTTPKNEYIAQLKSYADALKQLFPQHKIRTALYYPLTTQWIEIVSTETSMT